MIFARTCGALFFLTAVLPGYTAHSLAQRPFQLPTANHALFEPGNELKFFVPTAPDKPWMTGCFGCVRSDGWQMHEGLDIRCLQRDRRGEPTDPVMATADGTVMYFNLRPSKSNYGNYVILRHVVEGLEIYSLYAHLHEVRPGLKVGQTVKAGEEIGTMGRTSNTAETITRERAHVHFELNLFLSDNFSSWYAKNYPREKNDHGIWNGQNLNGLDPRELLLQEQAQGAKFSLLNFVRNQTELCRVLVRAPTFSFARRYAALIRPNPVAQREGTAGYEIALNFNAVPFELIPRAASEIKAKGRYQLVSVNEAEYQKNHCRKLVIKRGSRWALGNEGLRELDLLTN